MPAKSKIAIDVTLGELQLLLRLGALEDTRAAGTPVYKLQQETKLSRKATRNALERVQAALGEFVLGRDEAGRIRASAAGQNVGRIPLLAQAVIEVARSPATDQGKLARYILGLQDDMERRSAEGEFKTVEHRKPPLLSIDDVEGEKPVVISSETTECLFGEETPMTTKSRIEPDVTLGELLMLHALTIMTHYQVVPAPEIPQIGELSSEVVRSALDNIENALGKVLEVDANGKARGTTAAARNFGEAAYLADYLIMLARLPDIDQTKLHSLIAEYVASAKSEMAGGHLNVEASGAS
jgi:hypothetical protein